MSDLAIYVQTGVTVGAFEIALAAVARRADAWPKLDRALGH